MLAHAKVSSVMAQEGQHFDILGFCGTCLRVGP